MMKVVHPGQVTISVRHLHRSLKRKQHSTIFNIRTGSALVDDPEGSRYPDRQAARDVAVAMARDLTVEGEQQDEDRQCWQVEIMDRANQLVMTMAFVDIRDPRASG
jgi:hypothetical protein